MRTSNLAVALACVPVQSWANPTTYELIASSREQVPGYAEGITFDSFGRAAAALSDTGAVAFHATLRGSPNATRQAIFSNHGGPLDAAFRYGDPAPGLPDGTLLNLLGRPESMDPNGGFLFRSQVVGAQFPSGSKHYATYFGTAANPAVLFEDLSPVPGFEGQAAFERLAYLDFRDADHYAFSATLESNTASQLSGGNVIFARSSDGYRFVAQEEFTSVPGRSDQFVQDIYDVHLNGQNQVAFHAKLFGEDISPVVFESAIFVERNGSLALVAQGRQRVPGGDADELRYRYFEDLRLNDAGQTVFLASLIGTGVDNSNRFGVLSESGGTLHLAARLGDQAPGMPAGVRFAGGFEMQGIDEDGYASFFTTLQGIPGSSGNQHVLYSERDQLASPIFTEGAQAPGLPDGVTFAADTFRRYYATDGAGHIVFVAPLEGDDVGLSNNAALYLVRPGGELELIVREGGLFDVDPDPTAEDLRLVTEFTGAPVGDMVVFNNSGQFTFNLTFGDRTESVVVATIPAPATGCCAVLGAALLARRRRDA